MLFCVGRNGKHAFADLKKNIPWGWGVRMGTFCLPREGAICKSFFYWNLINDPLLIRA